jgi:hypothetical protein
MQTRPAAPTDEEAVADVFLAAKAEMTYLPNLHTEGDTLLGARRCAARA